MSLIDAYLVAMHVEERRQLVQGDIGAGQELCKYVHGGAGGTMQRKTTLAIVFVNGSVHVTVLPQESPPLHGWTKTKAIQSANL